MQLGKIFSETQGEPLIGKEVEFRLIKTMAEGQSIYKIKGVFHILTEEDRRRAITAAQDSLNAEYTNQYPPQDIRMIEEKIWMMAYCIYDPEDQRRRLFPNDVALFKKGITLPVLDYLVREYEKFVIDEYPEIVSADQFEDLASQAIKK